MKNRKLLYIILLFWLISTLYLLLGTLIFANSTYYGLILVVSSQIILLVQMLICLFYIFPKYWKRNKIPLLTVSTVILILAVIAIRYLLDEVLFVLLLNFPKTANLNLQFFMYENFYHSLPGIFIALITFLMVQLLESQQDHKNLQADVQQAELIFLKSQINPHFLYNTLNYMYAQALPISQKLADAILHLSDTMRHTLTQNEKQLTSLQEEIQFIENYIKLHALQHNQGICFQMSIDGPLDGKEISPLVLMPFVENAIKHGVLNDANKPISIILETTDNEIIFKMQNHISNRSTDLNSGLGLDNLRRRLEIMYPAKHILTIFKDDYLFKICLKIKITG